MLTRLGQFAFFASNFNLILVTCLLVTALTKDKVPSTVH